MLKKCKKTGCNILYETTWQDPAPHRRNRADEGPWRDNINPIKAERMVVSQFLLGIIRREKGRALKDQYKGRKYIQTLQQVVDDIAQEQ